MHVRRFLTGFLGAAALAAGGLVGLGCDFPYQPEPGPMVGDEKPVTTRALYPINRGIQVCNESMPADNRRFPASMLWLNFQGNLGVTVPEQWANVFTLVAGMHDRLTVTDTSNTVRWFFMKPAEITAELQDPEWTTHPDYIGFLGGVRGATARDKIWSGWVVRVNDDPLVQQTFIFNKNKLTEYSTPHVWMPESVTSTASAPADIVYDPVTGMADAASVEAFFGTRNVKIAFSLGTGPRDLTIYYYDYSEDNPQLRALKKGNQIAGWSCESPMFSPDGQWIAFNAHDPSNYNDNYRGCIQRLSPESEPVLISSTNASDPRWFADGMNTYIVYSTKGGPSPLPFELKEEDADGSLGSTMLQKVNLSETTGNRANWLMFDGGPRVLVGLPFKGGLSRDGKFLCTGGNKAYLYRLN